VGSRLKLHEELCTLLGSRNVYYQPPTQIKMEYPCIRYSLSGIDQKHANNGNYKNTTRYEITLIDYDPDTAFLQKILEHFPMCSFDRPYAANNLNHFVFTLYY
jgi:hypothetical protein